MDIAPLQLEAPLPLRAHQPGHPPACLSNDPRVTAGVTSGSGVRLRETWGVCTCGDAGWPAGEVAVVCWKCFILCHFGESSTSLLWQNIHNDMHRFDHC